LTQLILIVNSFLLPCFYSIHRGERESLRK
jgi:hypothetical protein